MDINIYKYKRLGKQAKVSILSINPIIHFELLNE